MYEILTTFQNPIQKTSVSKALGRPINPQPPNIANSVFYKYNPYLLPENKLRFYTSFKDTAKDRYGQLINATFLDDVFDFDVLAPPNRHVTISLPSDDYLNMREVQVYDYNSDIINLALGKSASQSSNYSSDHLAGRAVDGNNSTISITALGTGTSVKPSNFPYIPVSFVFHPPCSRLSSHLCRSLVVSRFG